MKKPILLIMCRSPRVGTNKTRLAKEIGIVKAWKIYRGMLTSIATRLGHSDIWKTILFVSPKRDVKKSRQWPLNQHKPRYQGQTSIGLRMTKGLTQVARGTPVILIGSDIPGIDQRIIQKAFYCLKSTDIVLGPSTDGGFWLIGFANRRSINKPFRDVRWSHKNTLTDTLKNLKYYKVSLTAIMKDIDTKKDYDSFKNNSLIEHILNQPSKHSQSKNPK